MPTVTGPVLVAGESLVDVVLGPDGRTLEETPGGAPLNIAVGLARLGVPTQLLTAFADDPYGELIGRHLEDSGVDLHPGSTRAPRTSVARALLDARHQASYEFDVTWEPPPARLPDGCRAVHVGSLGTVVDPGAAAMRALAEQARSDGLVVSYDPNVRPVLLADVEDPWTDVRRHAAASAVVKMSDQDADYLQPGRDLDDMLDELLAEGDTLLAAVTRGEHGLRLATRSDRVDVAAPAVDVVDTVGAGDACMAGILAALHARDRLDLESLAELTAADLSATGSAAATVAALTCARRGANPPWLRELPRDWPPEPR